MTATQLRIRLNRWRLDEPVMWLPVLIAAMWTAGALVLGFELEKRTQFALLLVPGGLAVAALLRWQGDAPTLVPAAVWTSTLAAAFLVAPAIARDPVVPLAVPAIAAGAWVSARWPAAGVTAIVLLTGSYGILQIHYDLPVGTIIDLLLGGLSVGTLWQLLVQRRRERLIIWPGMAAVALYLAVTAVAIPLSPTGISLSLKSFHNTAWYMLALPLVVYAPWSHETRMRIARAIVVVAGAVGTYACLQLILGAPAEDKAYVALLPQNGGVQGDLGLFGSFLSKKELAAWCAPIVPFVFGFALFSRGRWRLASLLATALCAVALFGTGARQPAAVAVAGMILCLFLYQFSRGFPGIRLGTTVLFAGLLVGGTIGAYAISNPGDPSKPYSAIFHPSNDFAFEQRQDRWTVVLREVPKKPFGHGLGTAGSVAASGGTLVSPAAQDLDNSYLEIAYQQGMAVMVLFAAAMVVLLIGLASSAVLTQSTEAAGLGIASAGVLFALAIEFYGAPAIEFFPALLAWIMIGLGVAEFTRRAAPDKHFPLLRSAK